jgi:hypothetical protein
MLAIMSKKLIHGGRVRILTDLEKDCELFTELVLTAGEAGFRPISNVGKTYFPNDWPDPEFRPNRKPQTVVLAPK